MSTPLRARTFFNPTLCPNCGGGLGTAEANLRCSWCGLKLNGATADRLGTALTEADRLLEQLRVESAAPAAAPQYASPQSAPPQYASPQYASPAPAYPPYVPVPTPRPPRRPLNVAAILLSLGALCLVVSAIVFVSINWGAMSLGAKVAVLTGITVLLAGLTAFVTRRGLRASAEALCAITFADLSIDIVAARHAGLASLENLSWAAYLAAALAALSLVALGTALWSARTKIATPLTTAQLAAGLSAPAALASALVCWNASDWLSETTMIVFAVAAAYGASRLRLPATTIPLAVAGAYAWLGLVGTGLVNALDDDYATRLVHGDEPHLVVAVVLTFGLAAISRAQVRPATFPLATAAFALFAALGLAITNDVLPIETTFAPLVLTFAVSAFVPRSVWTDAARWVFAALLAGGALTVAASALAGLTVLDHLPRIWEGGARQRLLVDADVAHPVLESFVMLGALLLGLAAAAAIVRVPLERFALWAAAIVAPVAAAILLQLQPQQWAGMALFAGAAVVSSAAAWTVGSRDDMLWWSVVPSVTMAHLLSLCTPGLTIVGFTLGGFASLAASLRVGARLELRTALEMSVLAHVFVVGSAATRVVQPSFARPEVVGFLTVAAATAVVCVVSESRRWWRWISAPSALLASWILASQLGHQVVEWYSIPLGAVALLFGVTAAHEAARTFDSWLYYGPGLLVLTVPSLVLAVEDPTTVRALLVGVWLTALITTGVALNLKAPLVIGAAGGAWLAWVELWPYAAAAPRWVSLGLAGVLLLVMGTTWEDRRANWTSAQRTLHGMR